MPRNDSMEKVLTGYKKRIAHFQIRHDNILDNLFKKYPELKKLRRKYAALRLQERKNKDNTDYLNKYQNVNSSYQKLLNECLAKENINSDVLSYTPICPICNDTGYVGDVEKSYCTCVVSKAAQLVLQSSKINDEQTLEKSDFTVFDDTEDLYNGATQKQLMQKLYEYIAKWANKFPNNDKKQLMIIGNVGLGKSYCLNAIAYEIINKGFTAMLISSFAINESAFDEIKKSDSSALNMMRSVDLLLIDDLGGEPTLNNITCPTLLNVLNERTRKNLHTVVSTNLNRDRLEEKYDSRVVSRLFDKARTVIPPILGKDIRKKHLR